MMSPSSSSLCMNTCQQQHEHHHTKVPLVRHSNTSVHMNVDQLALERAVGITEYLRDAATVAPTATTDGDGYGGWEGLIKQACEDFVVVEVSLDGTLQRITDFDITTALAGQRAFNAEQRRLREEQAVIDAETEPTPLKRMKATSIVQPINTEVHSYGPSKAAKDAEEDIMNALSEEMYVAIDAFAQRAASTASIEPIVLSVASNGKIGADIITPLLVKWVHLDASYSKTGEDLIVSVNLAYKALRTRPELDHITAAKIMRFTNPKRQALGPRCVDMAREMMLPPEADKVKRTQVHRIVAEYFPDVTSKAISSEESSSNTFGSSSAASTSICLTLRAERQGRPRLSKKRKIASAVAMSAVSQEPGVLSFVMRKVNLTGSDALKRLARAADCGATAFSVAGTKDKRAVTYQKVTVVPTVDVRKLSSAFGGQGTVSTGSLRLGNFQMVSQRLNLGDHNGNAFGVIIRNIRPRRSVNGAESVESLGISLRRRIHASLEEFMLSRCGIKGGQFLNYFGTQRFSTSAAFSTNSGAATGRALLRGEFARACLCTLDGEICVPDDEAEALSELQRIVDEHIEWSKSKNKNNGKDQGDRKRRRVTAQHEALVRSLHRYGITAESVRRAFCELPMQTRSMPLHAYQSLLFNRMLSLRFSKSGSAAVMLGDLVRSSEPDDPTVTIVTSEAEASRYSLCNVVLPLIGGSVGLPDTPVGEAARRWLNEDGVTSAMLSGSKASIGAPLAGGYRHVIAIMRNLAWEWEGEDDAVRLSFLLMAGEYATIAIREWMRGPCAQGSPEYASAASVTKSECVSIEDRGDTVKDDNRILDEKSK